MPDALVDDVLVSLSETANIRDTNSGVHAENIGIYQVVSMTCKQGCGVVDWTILL